MKKWIVIRRGDINPSCLDCIPKYSRIKITLIHQLDSRIKLFRYSNVREFQLSKNFLKILTSGQDKEEHWFHIESIKLIILRGDFCEGV